MAKKKPTQKKTAKRGRKPKVDEADGVKVGEEPVPGMTLRCICRGHEGTIGRIAWSPCGRFIASPSEDNTIRIWNATDGKCLKALEGHDESVCSVSWSNDSAYLASGGMDGRVILWETDSWRTFSNKPVLHAECQSLGWFPNELGLIAGGDGTPAVRWTPQSEWGPEISASDATCIEWSPDGKRFAIGGSDGIVTLIDSKSLKEIKTFDTDFDVWILGIAWLPNSILALSSEDSRILIWDLDSDRKVQELEGHTGSVTSLCSFDGGRTLFSVSVDDTIRVWNTSTWAPIASIPNSIRGNAFPGLATDRSHALAASSLEGRVVTVWDIQPDALSSSPHTNPLAYTSAKIVLVGESNVGKSCLAMRLAEDRYPDDHEHGTTHGMRFWPMEATTLHPAAKSPEGQRRDVVLWDFGGQDEYQLVHQMFLHDTTLALVLIDPTRGRAAMDEARDWNKRLEKHLGTDRAIKLLVGAKVDRKRDLIDVSSIDALCKECGFAGFLDLSAKTGRNTKKLRKLISDALNWDRMARTSRPELFQHIRDNIEARRKKKQVVLTLEAFKKAIQKTAAKIYEEAAVDAVSDQLATQGIIVRTQLTGGEEALVLQLPVIERYAGSLIVLARNNGVPVIEERQLSSIKDVKLPGMLKKERLSPTKERMVLECIVELMIQHGICFRHAGMLVFPTLFPATESDDETLPHSVSLYYDFTGAIDNIYASLVSKLMVGEGFGEGRLLSGRVEFEQSGQGICGIRQVTRKGGFAHIDMFFSEVTPKPRRNLFIRFVEEHLREQGVDIREHQAIKCECGEEIKERIVQQRMRAGNKDVICPVCEKKTLISDVADTIRERDHDSDERILALRKRIEYETSVDAEMAKGMVAGKRSIDVWKERLAYLQEQEAIASDASKKFTLKHEIAEAEQRIEELSLVKMKRPEMKGLGNKRLLHLSDLHFTGETSVQQHLVPLLQDIRNGEHLGFDSVEYLVISGDMTDKGDVGGFGKARKFVQRLIEELGLSAQRCVFVPGNHDVHDVEEAWQHFLSQKAAREYGATEETWQQEGRVYLVEDREEYKNRFRDFSNSFFHKIVAVQGYPLEAADQGISYLFEDTGIQFLTLNSAWQIDQFNRDRSGIHPEAVLNAVAQADKLRTSAIDAGRMKKKQKVLRIGVWHHTLEGKWAMQNDDFLEHLQLADVKLCLHGDVHEMRRKYVREWDKGGVHIIGAGTFGAPESGRPESTPRLYNLIEFADDLSMVRVHTRLQKKQHGAWSGFHEWPDPEGGKGKVPYFDIDLS